jgi:hypothetical protein
MRRLKEREGGKRAFIVHLMRVKRRRGGDLEKKKEGRT